MMDPQRWEEIERLYHMAREREAGEREKFLAEACGGDEPLRREVQSLLARPPEGRDFLEAPALEVAARALANENVNASPIGLVGRTIAHYRVLEKIGEGGMGEVFLADDTSLHRKVALKFLPPVMQQDLAAHKRFIREARAAAALDHPYICHINEVAQFEGHDFIVMEYVDGDTLKDRLARGPLPLKEALQIAGEVAEALEAAHGKGIIHRDIKPANIMMTRAGHAKVMDFGLAKLTHLQAAGADAATVLSDEGDTAAGVVLGTVGYMAPEQIRAQEVDQRTDIFSFGCVLYEMLSGQRAFQGATAADTMSAILTREPPPLSSAREHISPALERIVRRCLEKKPDDRFSSARDLGFALQTVAEATPRETARRPEEPRPYPGLAAFTEEDAGRFFGRNEEVAALWRKIPERSLLALIGPSGAGKTSFLRAGIMSHAPPGWRCLVATPGRAPFAGLARALAPAFAGDAGAFQKLLDFSQPEVALSLVARWRDRVDHGLVIVDQFEELYTLNGEEMQGRFAELLGRIAALDGVHVLLSMRDDFFFRCSAQDALSGVFSTVTPLRPLTRAALADALIEPAKRFGFAFEDDGLVEEMVQAVEGERGALPLLAFAVARLWEERDRERKLLTREGYERLGGVAGALVQHAEATLERIGTERAPIVQELFRNLATAQQTRCVVDAGELLSVFPEDQRGDARQVLGQLVDARLLTSFEVEAPDGARHDRVEVVHESLLQRWPRLQRWQAQDAEGALLRDQLKQAAHLWEEKGRPADLLWSGTSFREYELWRERYPGALTALEEAFAKAMAGRARRRKRLLTVAVASVIAVLACVAIAISLSRQQAVRARDDARAEAGRREAAQLLSLGRLRIADHPNAALAYAIASLERSDNDPARRFAVEALWQGPPALYLPPDPVIPCSLQWSPDGRWIASGGKLGLLLLSRDTGERRQISSSWTGTVGFTSDGRWLVTDTAAGKPLPTALQVWALPEGRLERTLRHPGESGATLFNDHLLTIGFDGPRPIIRRLSLDGSTQQVLGRWEPKGLTGAHIDPSATWIFWVRRGRVLQQRLDALSAPGRVIGAHEGDANVRVAPWRDRAATGDSRGEVRIWNIPSARLERTLKSPADARFIALDPQRRFLATGPAQGISPRSLFLFDLAAPRTAECAPLLGETWGQLNGLEFSPDGSWLASVDVGNVTLWNMRSVHSIVLGRQDPPFTTVAFTPDGDLLSMSDRGPLRRWLLSPAAGDGVQTLLSQPGGTGGGSLLVDPGGCFVLTPFLKVVRLDGSKPANYQLKTREGMTLSGGATSLDPGGRFVALTTEDNSIQILNLATGELRRHDSHPKSDERCEGVGSEDAGGTMPVWLRDGRLLSDGDGGLREWDLVTGKSRLLRPCRKFNPNGFGLFAGPDSRMVLRLDPAEMQGSVSSLSVFDLASRSTREISSHANMISSLALDARGTILVTGDKNGVVRVGPVAGEEPHLLFGHTGPVSSVAVSPDGRWIASGSDDGTIRLWPMPDLSKPPLHTLPHDALLAKLKSLTNLRAVRDPSSDTGWKIETGPFPGWAIVPDWQP